MVDLEETIFELGLRSPRRSTPEPTSPSACSRRAARCASGSSRSASSDWVERFDPARYNRNATLAENLLFGTPVGRVFDIENLAGNAYVRQVLRETGLHELLVRTGHKVAETMVELFSGLPPGHEFFAQYSFINQDDLPQFEAILQARGRGRAEGAGRRGQPRAARAALQADRRPAPPGPDRRGLRGARDRGAAPLRRQPARRSCKGAVEFFDPERYNGAATLQDNILFGKIVTGQAGAVERITKLVRELLDELGLRPMVVRNGLDFQVGVGGARLRGAPTGRRWRWCARCSSARCCWCSTRPPRCSTRRRSSAWSQSVLAERKGQGVIWVLSRPEYAERFGVVLVMERGRLVESGAFAELKRKTG